MKKERHRLLLLISVAFSLRVLFSLSSDHVYHPDEIFQSLEPAFRFVNGYGLIPWDLTYKLRPGIFILSFTPLQYLAAIAGFSPAITHLLIKVSLAAASLLILLAGYVISQKMVPKASLLVVFNLAIWYELVYFSNRALSETFSLFLISLALIILYTPQLPRRHLLSTLSLTCIFLACYIRPQYAILVPFMLYPPSLRHNLRWSQVMIASISGLLIALLGDYILYRSFTLSLINNLRFSFFSGVSELFGTAPFEFYFTALLASSAGTYLLILKKKSSAYRLPFSAALALIVLHSLVPHKEYRFIVAAIPILVMLSSLMLYEILFPRTKHPLLISALLFTTVSFLGFLHRIPYLGAIYPYPFFLKDPHLQTSALIGKRNDACGFFNATRGWVYSGGYYYLNQNIPLYTNDYPPPTSTAYNYSITAFPQSDASQLLPGFVTYANGATLVQPAAYANRSEPNCLPQPYDYTRSFSYLEPYLP